MSPATSLAMVETDGADIGRKPLRLSWLIRSSIRSRLLAEVKPHEEGEAYIKEPTVVALATRTSCNCGAERSWLRRILREEAHELRTCSLMPRSEDITTPRTRREVTRSAPQIIGRVGRPTSALRTALLKTISS